MVKPISVPDNDFAAVNLRYELGSRMAIAANSQVLHNPDTRSWRRVEEGKGNGQLFAMPV